MLEILDFAFSYRQYTNLFIFRFILMLIDWRLADNWKYCQINTEVFRYLARSFVVGDFCPTLALLFISFWEGGLHRLLPLSLPGGSEAACRWELQSRDMSHRKVYNVVDVVDIYIYIYIHYFLQMENMLNVRLAVITNSTYKTKYYFVD